MLDLTKKYRTRDGREVRDLRLDPTGVAYPLIGRVLDDDGATWINVSWAADGTYDLRGKHKERDLVEVVDVTPQPFGVRAMEYLTKLRDDLISIIRRDRDQAAETNKAICERLDAHDQALTAHERFSREASKSLDGLRIRASNIEARVREVETHEPFSRAASKALEGLEARLSAHKIYLTQAIERGEAGFDDRIRELEQAVAAKLDAMPALAHTVGELGNRVRALECERAVPHYDKAPGRAANHWYSGENCCLPRARRKVLALLRHPNGKEYYGVVYHDGDEWRYQNANRLRDSNPWRDAAKVLKWMYVEGLQ